MVKYQTRGRAIVIKEISRQVSLSGVARLQHLSQGQNPMQMNEQVEPVFTVLPLIRVHSIQKLPHNRRRRAPPAFILEMYGEALHEVQKLVGLRRYCQTKRRSVLQCLCGGLRLAIT
jgi:hypothetical protein